MRAMKCPLMCRQKVPGILQGKIESVLARLGRLNVELGGTVGDKDESKRRTLLFEWVSFAPCERAFVLIPTQDS